MPPRATSPGCECERVARLEERLASAEAELKATREHVEKRNLSTIGWLIAGLLAVSGWLIAYLKGK